jgi:hypothetical protein
VKAAFLVRNVGSPADFEAALQHAAGEGWLTRSLDWIRLTTLGAEEMQTVSWPLREPIRTHRLRGSCGKDCNFVRARSNPESAEPFVTGLAFAGYRKSRWNAPIAV